MPRPPIIARGGIVDPNGVPSRDSIESDEHLEPLYFDEETTEWEDERGKSMKLLADALGGILGWVVQGNIGHKDYQTHIATKALALVWCLRPDLLGHKTLRELTRENGIHIKIQALSKWVSHFTKEYGMFHGGQRTNENRKVYQDARNKVVRGQRDGV